MKITKLTIILFLKIIMKMKMKYILILQEISQSFKIVIIQQQKNNTNFTHWIIDMWYSH